MRVEKRSLIFMTQQALKTDDQDARLAALDAAGEVLPAKLAKLAKRAARLQREAYQADCQLTEAITAGLK